MPFSNSEVMKAHLCLISNTTPKGKHAVVIMDRASWYQSYLAQEFTNRTIVHLPPYSPELNSIEQVWQWMPNNEIANKCFDDYNDIVNKYCDAWNRFSEDKNKVISQCYRDRTNLKTYLSELV